MAALLPLRRLVRWLCLALLAGLIVTPLAQIVMRGVFNVPMSGAEEMARYFLICLTFLGGSYVTAEGGQVKMEEFQALISPRLRWLLQLAIEVAGILLFGLICAASWSRSATTSTTRPRRSRCRSGCSWARSRRARLS
jgi:TRAP-type C4-dicarboxylate transport system permease small subunit